MGGKCSMDPQDGNLDGRLQTSFGKYQMRGWKSSMEDTIKISIKVSWGHCKFDSVKVSSGGQHLDHSRYITLCTLWAPSIHMFSKSEFSLTRERVECGLISDWIRPFTWSDWLHYIHPVVSDNSLYKTCASPNVSWRLLLRAPWCAGDPLLV